MPAPPPVHPLLARLGPIPPRRPPRARPIALPAWTVQHGGCRWVQPEEFVAVSTPYWTLSWIDRPALAVAWGSGRGRVEEEQGPDVILLIPPGLLLHRIARVPCVHLHLQIGLGLPCRLDRPHRHPVGAVEADLLRRCAAGQVGRAAPVAAEAVATAALLGLVVASMPAAVWPAIAGDQRIRSLLDRMRADPLAPWRNRDLARAAGLSAGRFLRLFRAETGASPQRLLRDLRLDRAAGDLRQGASVKSTIATCGWRDRASFTRQFRNRFGRPPAAWIRHADR